MMNTKSGKLIAFLLGAAALLLLPILLQSTGSNSWVRIVDIALLYVLLALGLNIVVGYAGLLDLGYIAFFAVGGYIFALVGSPHLTDTFPAIAAMFPNGIHISIWLVMILAAAIAGFVGIILGAPTLKLRGDYLAIITLGFGEIIRIFLLNMDRPVNITNGPKGISQIDSISVFGVDLGKRLTIGDFTFQPVTLYYYLFLFFVVLAASGAMASSRIWHACEGAQQMERVEALSGTPRTIFRRNDEVRTFWPQSRVVRSDRRDASGLFPRVPLVEGTSISQFYAARPVGQERVAGFVADVVWFKPVDSLRFGYKLWSERETGLVVKLQTLGANGRVLEQAAFSELDLNAPVRVEQLSRLMDATAGYKVVAPVVVKTTATAEGWVLRCKA